MPERWQDVAYQTIEAVRFEQGLLLVSFANGDEAEVPVDGLLSVAPDGVQWAKSQPRGLALLVPTDQEPLEVSWLTLRGRSDPTFAQYLVAEADQEAQRIGRRIRLLRERRGMTAKQVAEAAGISAMSMSRIELGRHDVVFRTLRRILAAMGYSLRDLADVAHEEVDAPTVLAALQKRGVPRGVVKQMRAALGDDAAALRRASRLVFDVEAGSVASTAPLRLAGAAAGGRYKSALNQRPEMAAYTMWAHWLAALVDQACPRPAVQLTENALAIRQDILDRYSRIRFESLLSWCWEHDVAVLPLQDPGEFHGACWSFDGRIVVVLKQLTPSSARWTFDLSHELAHAARHLNGPNAAVVELEEIRPAARQDDDDEVEANDFADELMLEDADALAQELAVRVDRQLPRLKQAVIALADERHVEVDALANYMAYRLAAEGGNWWSTAARLQDDRTHAPEFARSVLFKHLDFGRLTDNDAALLRAALDWS